MSHRLAELNILTEICQYLSADDIRAIASTCTILRAVAYDAAYQLNAVCHDCKYICTTKLVLGTKKPVWWCVDCSRDCTWLCWACDCYDTRIFTALSVQDTDGNMFVHRTGECVFGDCGRCNRAITSRMNAWIHNNDRYRHEDENHPVGYRCSDIVCLDCLQRDDDRAEATDLMEGYRLVGLWSRAAMTEPKRWELGWAESYIEFEFKRELNPRFVSGLNEDVYSDMLCANIDLYGRDQPTVGIRKCAMLCGRCNITFDHYDDVRYISAPLVQSVGISWVYVHANSEYQESTFILNGLKIQYMPQPLENITGLYCRGCMRVLLNTMHQKVEDDSLLGLLNSADSMVDEPRMDEKLIYSRIHPINYWPECTIEETNSVYSYDSDDYRINEFSERIRSNSV